MNAGRACLWIRAHWQARSAAFVAKDTSNLESTSTTLYSTRVTKNVVFLLYIKRYTTLCFTLTARLQVALKTNQAAHDPLQMLHAEAELHAYAWLHLPYVLRPLGFLDAHDPSGTPAVLVVEIGV